MSRHRRGSVVGTALSLMISTVLSAGLTFGFWVVAAPSFAPDAVGRISAQVASMTLLAAVALFVLPGLVSRYRDAQPRAPKAVRAPAEYLSDITALTTPRRSAW